MTINRRSTTPQARTTTEPQVGNFWAIHELPLQNNLDI